MSQNATEFDSPWKDVIERYFQDFIQFFFPQAHIELGLNLKFGSEGLATLPEISGLQDVEQLRAILVGLKTANTLSDLRQIYQP